VLNARNRRHGIPLMPAMMPMAWRSPSTNRRGTGAKRNTSRRPPKWPIAYPMLSPATAAAAAMRMAMMMMMLRWPAPA
jgi:hypothetical protein